MNDWYEYEFTSDARSEGPPRFSIASIIFATFVIGVVCAMCDYGLGRDRLFIAWLYFVSHAITLYAFIAVLRKPAKSTPSSRPLLDEKVKRTTHNTRYLRRFHAGTGAQSK